MEIEKKYNDDAKKEVLITFDNDYAEIYIGGKAIKVDYDTAMGMIRQRVDMPEGKAWQSDFPSVENHTSAAKARQHADFHSAKHGDFDAARRLIDDLVKDDKVKAIAERYKGATVVYIHRKQDEGINMIPAAYAAKFASMGMSVEHEIYAITNVSHTNATDMARISRRMRFEGPVCRGKDYIILDDFITSGAELRDMKDYITSKGGNVVMITTLGHGSFGKLTNIGIDEIYTKRLKESGVTDSDLRKYGIASGISCLTLSEAAKLSRVVNAGRKREVENVSSGIQFLFRYEQNHRETERELQKPIETLQIAIGNTSNANIRCYHR